MNSAKFWDDGAQFHAALVLALSLSRSSPLSLPPTTSWPPSVLAAQSGYRIYCIWLRCGSAALSVWGSSPAPPFSPAAAAAAVGLGIKIRHFIVSKFCEADNIAAPIAAAAAGGEREEPFGVGFATA